MTLTSALHRPAGSQAPVQTTRCCSVPLAKALTHGQPHLTICLSVWGEAHPPPPRLRRQTPGGGALHLPAKGLPAYGRA